jgi:hypothetical protein
LRKTVFTIFLLFASLLAPVAHAADCATLRILNSVPIHVEHDRILLPVRINDKPFTFLLDTGGAITQISPAVVQALHLVPDNHGIKLIDMYGHASDQAVRASLTLGVMQDRNALLPVSPLELPEGTPYQGILAADFLGRYDIELDLAGGKLNYFSPDHCPGRVVYWNAPAVAVVSMQLLDNHIRAEADLDGHKMTAILDTGASITTLKAAYAERIFSITESSPGNLDAGEIDGKKQFVHVFPTLGLEGIAVSNPRVLIMPDLVGTHDPSNDHVLGSRAQRVDDARPTDPPLIIGMNVISRLHVYMAFGEGKLYVTPAAGTNKAH